MDYRNQKFTGYWFVPDQNKKWYGTLSFSDKNNIYLDFVLTNEEIKDKAPQVLSQLNNINNQTKIPIICGYVKSHNANKDISFTLSQLELINIKRSGLFKITLEAEHALTYNHFNSLQNPFIKSVMLKFDGFDKWIDKNGFDVTEDNKNDKPTTAVGFQQPEAINLIDNEELNAYFYFRATYPAFLVRGPIATIEQSLYLNLEFKEYQAIETVVSHNEKIQNFFTFLFYTPTARIDCQIRLTKDKNATDLDLIYPEIAPDYSNIISHGMYMFYYTDYEEKFPEMFRNWIDLYKLYEPALDQFFDNQYYNNGHVVSKFVSILSIIEIYYHRKFETDKPLAEKLKEIIQLLASINTELFNYETEFLTETVKIRRYFVHGADTKKNMDAEKFSKEYVSNLVRKLENIFRILILLELGLSEQEIIKLIRRRSWMWGITNT